MTTPINDGGPVFARPVSEHIHEGLLFLHESQKGISLRQYYAGLAMQGLMSNSAEPQPKFETVQAGLSYYASLSVHYADALITELSKQP